MLSEFNFQHGPGGVEWGDRVNINVSWKFMQMAGTYIQGEVNVSLFGSMKVCQEEAISLVWLQ